EIGRRKIRIAERDLADGDPAVFPQIDIRQHFATPGPRLARVGVPTDGGEQCRIPIDDHFDRPERRVELTTFRAIGIYDAALEKCRNLRTKVLNGDGTQTA